MKPKIPIKNIINRAKNFVIDNSNIIPKNEYSLLHGDMHQSNLFINDGKIVGLIDWTDAIYGDPLHDFARFRMNIMQRMDDKALEEYYRALNLSRSEKKLEEIYFIIILTRYLAWYALSSNFEMLKFNQNLLKELLP